MVRRCPGWLLLLLLATLSLAATSDNGARPPLRPRLPRPRNYELASYYVMEMDPRWPDLDASWLAGQVGLELVEPLGELAHHWLVRTPLRRRSLWARAWRLLGRAEQVSPEDAVVLDRLRRSSLPVLSLERQTVRQRVKRRIPRTQRRQEPVADDYLADLARRFSISDPLWPKQWHLANDQMRDNSINVTGVWAQGITGKGVVVSIVDDGLDSPLSPTSSARTRPLNSKLRRHVGAV